MGAVGHLVLYLLAHGDLCLQRWTDTFELPLEAFQQCGDARNISCGAELLKLATDLGHPSSAQAAGTSLQCMSATLYSCRLSFVYGFSQLLESRRSILKEVLNQLNHKVRLFLSL